jgi:hypothetical protein
MATPIELVKNRPAETAMPIATVFAALIARLLGVEDTDTILYIALAISFVPAIVTWIVDMLRQRSNGGTTYQPPNDIPSVEQQSVTKPKPVAKSKPVSKPKPDEK